MAPKLFEDDDDCSPNEDISKIEVDENYGRRLEYNRTRQDLQKYEERKKRGDILSSDESDESSEEYEPDDDIGNPEKDLKFFESLIKVRRQDPLLKNKDVKLFESDEEDGEDENDVEDDKDEKDKKKKKKKKKMLLKDVQAKHLIEEGPDFDVGVEEKVKTYAEEQEELRKALLDAVEAAGAEADEDDEDLLRVKETKSENLEVDDEFVKKVDEYFGEDGELDENTKFLRDFFTKQMWKEKDEKGKRAVIDEAELDDLEQDEDELERQEEYETNFRHEEEDAGALKNYPRKVEDSVRNKENPRKAQRKSKEERMRIAEMERQEELKRLKNLKKKEIKEKMNKVLAIAGFKEGEECPIDPKDLDDEFDPEEYDKMMKAVFDDKYYGEDDSGFGSDEDEKPDFEKEDELLGLPKDWDVIKPGDGFLAAREKTLKMKEDVIGDEEVDGEAEEEEEEEEGSDNEEEEKEGEEQREEEATESKRKRKRKASLVQRAKEALMEEYYKLDYEDTIGDLKTRFKYAKVEPNKYGLKTEEILVLDDKDLNQFVSLKKIAPYQEKEWKLHKRKKHEQKQKIKELLRNKKSGHKNGKKGEKKRPRSENDDEKKHNTEEAEGQEDDTSKLSRKAKRRRRQSELKPSHSRLMGYQKARANT